MIIHNYVTAGDTLYQFYWPTICEAANYLNGDYKPHDLEYCVAIFRIKLKPIL